MRLTIALISVLLTTAGITSAVPLGCPTGKGVSCTPPKAVVVRGDEAVDIPDTQNRGGTIYKKDTDEIEVPDTQNRGGTIYRRGSDEVDIPDTQNRGGTIYRRDTGEVDIPDTQNRGGTIYRRHGATEDSGRGVYH